MENPRPLGRFRLDDPMTVAMYVYGAFTIACGVWAPTIGPIERAALRLHPTTLIALVKMDQDFRPLLTVVPILFAATVPVAAVTTWQISRQSRYVEPASRLKLATMSLISVLIAIFFVALPTYLEDPTYHSVTLRGAALDHLLSSSVIFTTLFCGGMFWGAHLFALLSLFILRRALSAA
jgi:hypothetical protein